MGTVYRWYENRAQGGMLELGVRDKEDTFWYCSVECRTVWRRKHIWGRHSCRKRLSCADLDSLTGLD